MAENREVKSDVFSMLMEDKQNALQVYNGLNGSNYKDPELIEMTTLKKGISLSIRNDASYIVDMNLNIYEHQSTYSPNMPLRSLIYLVNVIKPLIKNRDLYGRKLIYVPTPHFVAFYNGQEKRPAVEVLKLSTAFEKKTENPELELSCTVYNINPGYNDELLEKCSVLREYTQFIERIRYSEKLESETPIEDAIKWCIKEDILKDFLSRRKEEVLKAMDIDMTFERREELIRRDEREDGRAEGRAEARESDARKIAAKLGMSYEEALKFLEEE